MDQYVRQVDRLLTLGYSINDIIHQPELLALPDLVPEADGNPSSKRCEYCTFPGEAVRVCARCQTAYCCEQCQIIDWTKGHHRRCKQD